MIKSYLLFCWFCAPGVFRKRSPVGAESARPKRNNTRHFCSPRAVSGLGQTAPRLHKARYGPCKTKNRRTVSLKVRRSAQTKQRAAVHVSSCHIWSCAGEVPSAQGPIPRGKPFGVSFCPTREQNRFQHSLLNKKKKQRIPPETRARVQHRNERSIGGAERRRWGSSPGG